MVKKLANSIANLESTIQSKINQAVEMTIEDIYNIYNNNLQATNIGEKGSMYASTGEYKRSLDKEVNGNTGRVFMNYEKIVTLEEPENGVWGVHMNFSGNDVREELITWLNAGTDNKFYGHPATNFYENTLATVEQTFATCFGNHLAALGIPIKSVKVSMI